MSAACQRILLSAGQSTLVDVSDYDMLNQWKWTYHGNGYAYRKDNKKSVMMHNLLMNSPKGMDVDHINMDKLDNRRSNLRIVTRSQNMANCKAKGGSSLYKGVYLVKTTGKWAACIHWNRKSMTLGHFVHENDAAKIYNNFARYFWGECARLNEIAA